jgi:hypothetical protein
LGAVDQGRDSINESLVGDQRGEWSLKDIAATSVKHYRRGCSFRLRLVR